MTDPVKIKEARRRLLTNLNILYPAVMSVKSLYRTVCQLDPTYDTSVYAKDIIYFIDKGWAEFVDNRIGGYPDFENKVIKLTAKGKEIAEGTGIDKALEI